MTVYLDLDNLLRIASHAVGEVLVRDYGLLESALARPASTVFGQDAYPNILEKEAALLHSLASNYALIDGNKRLAWHATAVFLFLNGLSLEHADDEAFDLVIDVASGAVTSVDAVAVRLASWAIPRT